MRQLSIDQIKNSRVKALQNANELIQDAEILFNEEQWPRVLFLCQISGEEIGKYIMLSSIFVQQISEVEIDWRRIWKRLTSHIEKYELVTYMEDVFLEKNVFIDMKKYNDKLTDESRNLDQFKQKSLYCDFTEEIPYCPSDIIGKEIAEYALKWAKNRFNLFNNMEKKLQEAKIPDKITKEFIDQAKKDLGVEDLYNKIKS